MHRDYDRTIPNVKLFITVSIDESDRLFHWESVGQNTA
jgi:hypothetical protein